MKIAICSQDRNYYLKILKNLYPQMQPFSSLGNSSEIIIPNKEENVFISFFNTIIQSQNFDKIIIDKNLVEKEMKFSSSTEVI